MIALINLTCRASCVCLVLLLVLSHSAGVS